MCWRMNQVPNIMAEVPYCGYGAFRNNGTRDILLRAKLWYFDYLPYLKSILVSKMCRMENKKLSDFMFENDIKSDKILIVRI